jgi:DNA primase
MDQIEEIKRKVDIVDLISESFPLKKSGRNFKASCPFHDEKTASFMVSQERQIFKCFGCQKGGDVFGWLMEREGMEFGEALRTLADKVGVELKSFRPSQDQQIKNKLLEINHLASEYYHYLLTSHQAGKKALEYLLKRGINKRSIKTFKLGFAGNEWEGLMNYLVKKKNYSLKDLESAGLIIKGSNKYYDRFRNRVMFPLFDHRKRVVGFAGRVYAQEQKEAKYINSPETVLYHKSDVLYGLETTSQEIKKKNKAVVVEGEIDAISSYQAGVKNVVAIKGSALTESQIRLLKRFGENIALALDADSAGDQAARRGIELAEKAGLSVRVIKLKYGKDPDECAQREARLWKDSVKTAIPIYDFFIESAVKRFGVKSPEGKRKVSEEGSTVLASISNQVVKAHYVKKLSEVLGVNEEAVMQEIDKAGLKQRKEPEMVKPAAERSREDRLTEYVLAIVFQMKDEVGRLVRMISEKNLVEGAAKKVIIKLKKWMKTRKSFNVNKFVESLPEELGAVVDQAYLTDLGEMSSNLSKLEKELNGALEVLEKMAVKTKLRELTEEIKQAEKEKDEALLGKLQAKFVEVSRGFKL